MNRRTFTQVLATAALGTAAPSFSAAAGRTASSPESTSVPFPLSVMLWTVFTNLPFPERLAKVAEAGYRNVELDDEWNKWSPAELASANEARKRLGIRFDATAGLRNGIVDPSARKAFLAELKQALAPMETLGCPAMIVLSGDAVPELSREAQHQNAIEALKQAATLVEGRTINGQPVRLLLECIHLEENAHYYLTSANEAIEIVRAVNHPQVQFLYDIYHEQMSFGQLMIKLEKHIDVIGLIHIADVPGRHEPGTGEINYGNIYRKLAELKYNHMVAMEFRPTADPVASLRTAREMVERTARV
jgi:hydroxypyruvate isomerase